MIEWFLNKNRFSSDDYEEQRELNRQRLDSLAAHCGRRRPRSRMNATNPEAVKYQGDQGGRRSLEGAFQFTNLDRVRTTYSIALR